MDDDAGVRIPLEIFTPMALEILKTIARLNNEWGHYITKARITNETGLLSAEVSPLLQALLGYNLIDADGAGSTKTYGVPNWVCLELKNQKQLPDNEVSEIRLKNAKFPVPGWVGIENPEERIKTLNDETERIQLLFPTTGNEGRCYFSKDSYGKIKIGWTEKDPNKRAHELSKQEGCSALWIERLASTPGTREKEHAFQRLWGHLWRTGEWFEPDEELLNWIARFKDGGHFK